MAIACPTPQFTQGFVRGVLDAADCHVTQQVEGAYQGLFGHPAALAAGLSAVLTIYVALYGFRLLTGGALKLSDVVIRVLQLSIVIALVTEWDLYQRLVYGVLFHGPEQLAQTVLRSIHGVGMDPFAQLEAVFFELNAAAADLWKSSTPNPLLAAAATADGSTVAQAAEQGQAVSQMPPTGAGPEAPGLGRAGPIGLWVAAYAMLLSSVGVLLVCKILLGLLLAVGPLFFVLYLFGSARGLLTGWLRATLGFSLAPMLVTLTVAMFLQVALPLIPPLQAARVNGADPTQPALALMTLSLVFAAVTAISLKVTGDMAGALSLPAPRAAAAADAETPPAAPAVFEPAADPRIAAVVAAVDRADPPTLSLPAASSAAVSVTVEAPREAGLGDLRSPEREGGARRLGQTYKGLGRKPEAAKRGEQP